MKFTTFGISRFTVRLGLIIALVVFSSISAFAADPGVNNGSSSAPPGNTASATLSARGGWVAYTLNYAGDNSQIALDLTYNADPSTEVNNAVTMDVYGPDAPPGSGGSPIGNAVWSAYGQREYILDSNTAGTYTLLIHNWDPQGESLSINLTATDISTSTPGPALAVLSASAGTMMADTQANSSTSAAAPSAPQSSSETMMSTAGSSSVSHILPAGGGWVAYTFNYAGDNSNVEFSLSTNPADDSTEVTNAIDMQVYSSDNPPPGGTPIGNAIWSSFDDRVWTFNSATAGTYTIVIHNWDPRGEQVTVNLTSTNTDTSTAGPALTMVSAMQ